MMMMAHELSIAFSYAEEYRLNFNSLFYDVVNDNYLIVSFCFRISFIRRYGSILRINWLFIGNIIIYDRLKIFVLIKTNRNLRKKK